jgi:hypothetical protein
MRDEETDLSFADFGTEGVSRRLYPSPADGAAEDGLARPAEDVARREGELSPTLRFGASWVWHIASIPTDFCSWDRAAGVMRGQIPSDEIP